MTYRTFAQSYIASQCAVFMQNQEKLEQLVYNDAIARFTERPTVPEFRCTYNWILEVLVIYAELVSDLIETRSCSPSQLIPRVMAEYQQQHPLQVAPDEETRSAARLYVWRTLKGLLDASLATSIEVALARGVPEVKPYRTQARKIIANVRNEKTGFAQLLRNGDFRMDLIPTATHADLWPELWAAPNMQFGRTMIIIRDDEDHSTPSLFQCGKCKQYTVKTVEYQTRSADEPMTVFCNCTTCGNRWKM
tara:strand:- start:504 stop:1250 length:747 start_codon:yes stop_codon:yes gene_type:complete